MGNEEDIERIKEVANKKNRWAFIHTFIKGVIKNSITSIGYGFRIVPNGCIKSPDEINSSGLKEIYNCAIENHDDWVKSYKVSGNFKDEMKFIINIAFTIANEDHVYEGYFKNLYHVIGKSYAKNVLGIHNIKSKDEIKMR